MASWTSRETGEKFKKGMAGWLLWGLLVSVDKQISKRKMEKDGLNGKKP